MKKNSLFAFIGIIVILAFVAGLVTTQATVGAENMRPTPTPSYDDTPDVPEESGSTGDVRGGSIELVGTGATQDLWTVVQWQGINDEWHDVDGWRGSFYPDNMVKWWVGYEDLGRGPFRWVVYQGETAVFTSDPFDLPADNGGILRVAFDNSTTAQTETAVVAQPAASSSGLTMSEAQHIDGAMNGFIVLQMAASSPVPADLWTQVEWQDVAGVWSNVDGWAGNFNENGQVIWWVAPEHEGTQPFRWVVYESEMNKTAVSTSPSFTLPYAYENVQIDLTN